MRYEGRRELRERERESVYSLEFAIPTIFNMWRSSLNLSSTVPLMASVLTCWPSFVTTPQHSMTSGHIRWVFAKEGLPKVEHSNVWPVSKFAETNKPKWWTFPPKPMPFGILSELKFTAHCKNREGNKLCSWHPQNFIPNHGLLTHSSSKVEIL